MATLKLPKPVDPAAPPKPSSSSRAKRAQQQLGKRQPADAGPPRGAAPPKPAPRPEAGRPPRAKGAYGMPPQGAPAGKRPFARPAAGKPAFGKAGEGQAPRARTAEGKPPFARTAEAKPPFGRTSEGKPPFARTREGKPPFATTREGKGPSARTSERDGARRRPRNTEPVPPPRAEPRAAPPPPAPRPAAPARTAPAHENPDDPRLSKLMSEQGICSRREADEWIENRWVKVDGRLVDQLGARVPRDAKIEVDPAARRQQREQVTILLNKPVGYVSGQPEDGHQPAMVLIKPENHWEEDPSTITFTHAHLRGLAPAGRLDIDSTGLIVFTQDGRVARRLIGADSEVEKEYLVRVEGTLTEEGMKLLHHGLELDGVKLKPARVSWANEDQLRFVLREGRKRQIRRMCEMVGLTVTALKRVRTGGVPLGKLPVGQWRYLRRDEKF